MLISVPTTGEIRMTLVERLLSFDKEDDVEIHFSKEFPTDVNRCEIAKYFLEETDHDTLVMIDDDIVPPENLVDLARENGDIISPVVFSTDDGLPYPAVFELDDGQTRVSKGFDKDRFEVDAVGTGCIIIKRHVLEAMDEPYFAFDKNDDGTMNTGEDINFCLKARDLGFDIVVSNEHVCGHISKVNLKSYIENLRAGLQEKPRNHNTVETRE